MGCGWAMTLVADRLRPERQGVTEPTESTGSAAPFWTERLRTEKNRTQ